MRQQEAAKAAGKSTRLNMEAQPLDFANSRQLL